MRIARSVVLAVALTLVAGCSLGGGSGAAESGGDRVARVHAPQGTTTVLGARGPAAQSLAVSRALFASAPVVVVAGAGERRAVAEASSYARKHDAPLLLAPTRRSGKSVRVTSRLRAELHRLEPEAILAVGHVAGRLRAAMPEADVVVDPAALPRTGRPEPLRGLTVLVSARARDAGALAARAGATVVGADVVPVHGSDPRADTRAIRALARHKPDRVLAVGRRFGPAARLGARVAVAETGTMLPGGGQVMFPGRRLVAMYGHPGAPVLGVLGEQGPDAAIQRADQLAAPYRQLSRVPVVPSFEILATIASGAPGDDGNYTIESSVDWLEPWVKKAGAHGMYVVLDLQPGRANLLDQAKVYRSLLTLPYVGLALDPEWKLQPGQRPLQQIGSVDAPEINSVIRWLARLTARHHLPQKLLVLHQFQLSMIGHEHDLDLSHDELAVLIHMDGQGAPSLKESSWNTVVHAAPKGVWLGFKNFFDEDQPMLTPAQTLARRPRPVMISYQ